MISRLILAATGLASVPTISHAQTQVDGRQIYDPGFFERFAPQTAADMLNRVPGFSIRNNAAGRGLGQGGTNVLINGERVTAKDTGAIEILVRTSASSVVRIEVADAARLGVTGLTGQVANVVTAQDRFSGNWSWSPQFRHGLAPRLTAGAASFNGKVRGVSYTVGLENESFRNGHRGPEYVFGPDGGLVETRQEDAQYFGENPSLTAKLSGGKKEHLQYNVTGSGTLFSFDGREVSSRPPGVVRVFRDSEDEWNAELSTELLRTVGPGDAKLITYYRFEHSPFVSRVTPFERGVLLLTESFYQIADEAEAIGRLEYAVRRPEDRSWEFAAEYAFNSLESDTAFETDGTGELVREEFDPVEVTEDRMQGSITYSRKLGKFAFQGSAGAEYSEIRSTVGAEQGEPRSFFRPKGFVTLAYPAGENFDIRGRFERAVGQLNFFAFVSSQNLQDEIVSAGNTELVPQQSWDGEVEFERRFGEEDKVILRLSGSAIEDRVDNVVIDGFDAIGNIEEAALFSIETEGTLLLDRFGVVGARVDFEGSRQFSALDDPLTGETRPFSGSQRYFASLEYRHDIPRTQWVYGASANYVEFESSLRARQSSIFSISEPQAEIFLQHKDLFGLNVTGYLANLLDQDERFERVLFEGLRSEGIVDSVESRSRDYKFIAGVDVRGTF